MSKTSDYKWGNGFVLFKSGSVMENMAIRAGVVMTGVIMEEGWVQGGVGTAVRHLCAPGVKICVGG